MQRLHRELLGESDRAAVLIATAMLEQSLVGLLQSYLVPLPSSSDTLFDGASAPMASLSAKIDLAFRLGLISSTFCRDLHLIRRIRNDFAHRAGACKFDDQDTKSRVNELSKSHGIFSRSPRWVAERGSPGLRRQFEEAALWMLYFLNAQRARGDTLAPKEPEFGYQFSYDVPSADGELPA